MTAMPDPLEEAGPEVADAIVAVEDAMGELATRFRVMIRDAASQVDPALQPFGLRILRLLERHGEMSAGQISEYLEVDPSSTSRQIRQLVELDLATVAACETDRRSRILSLSDHGRERLAAIGPSGRARMQRALSGWELSELRRFAEDLKRLTDSVS
ncbi:MarR family transcriptional regulator [Aeromicrobium camelliae]|uniref:MarR family transcriptional regulator n=1 Tax=Aeromicrobium camelliae TaxID=1538144 RepID=A0A3N6WXM5_9ACTN|nr:MarR family transcriptional regulator [Aeromicrobium camelliae]RQN09792.1 MarR family transcriptional regulator [Aeromicrobium camelliae]